MAETRTLRLPALIRKQNLSPSNWTFHIQLLDSPEFILTRPDRTTLADLLGKAWVRLLKEAEDPTPHIQLLEHLASRKTIATEKLKISVKRAGKEQQALVWIHRFQIGEQHFLSFPDFKSEVIACPHSNWNKRAQQFVRNQFKASQEGALIGANEGDYVAPIEINIPLLSSPHYWEHQTNNTPPSPASQDQRHGKQELIRLARNLNTLFPGRLKRSWGRSDLNQQFYRLAVEDPISSIVILGEEGTGRHSLVQETVFQYMNAGGSRERVFWMLNPNRIISGMSIIGQWQKRMESILAHLQTPNDNEAPDLLVIDQVLPLVSLGANRSGHFALADIMADWLARKKGKIILIATPKQWSIVQGQNRRFADFFRPVLIPEPKQEQLLPMLVQKKRALEKQSQTIFTIQAMQEIMALYDRHLKPKPLPGAVGDLLDQLAEAFPAKTLRAAESRLWFMQQNGIPSAYPAINREDHPERFLRSRLIGQEQATFVLSRVISMIQTRLQPQGKPISTLLFVGPTGVGKTQAAKVLSQALYGDDQHLLRFDMNEFGDAGAVRRLIGGRLEGDGLLTAKVKRQPFGVLLLDEIEKAHPSVHNLLLQVLDDGRLTNVKGQTTYFHNLVIIMTSNLGVRESQSQLGYQKFENQASLFTKAVESFFRPELVNRIDEVVIFKRLQPKDILPIARLQINELLQRDGLIRRTTLLNLSPDALEWLAHQGYDAQMGGRALKRTIEKELTVLAADQLLRIPPQTPLILDILLQKGKLDPVLYPIRFEPFGGASFWQNLQSAADDRRLLSRLRREVDHFLKETNTEIAQQSRPGHLIDNTAGQEQWVLFHHKERLTELQEEVLLFQADNRKGKQGLMVRFKQASILDEHGVMPLEVDQPGKLLDPQLLESIQEAHPLAQSLILPERAPILALAQKVKLARRMQAGVLDEQSPLSLELYIRKRTGPPKPALLQQLKEQFAQFFHWLDLKYEWIEKKSAFELEGIGIRELLQGEIGYHLFVEPHQNPTLFQLSFEAPSGESDKEDILMIKRLYFSGQLLFDLRKGCTGFLPIRPEEYLFLL